MLLGEQLSFGICTCSTITSYSCRIIQVEWHLHSVFRRGFLMVFVSNLSSSSFTSPSFLIFLWNSMDPLRTNNLLTFCCRLWHISRSECLCCFQHIDFVTAICFHPRVSHCSCLQLLQWCKRFSDFSLFVCLLSSWFRHITLISVGSGLRKPSFCVLNLSGCVLFLLKTK